MGLIGLTAMEHQEKGTLGIEKTLDDGSTRLMPQRRAEVCSAVADNSPQNAVPAHNQDAYPSVKEVVAKAGASVKREHSQQTGSQILAKSGVIAEEVVGSINAERGGEPGASGNLAGPKVFMEKKSKSQQRKEKKQGSDTEMEKKRSLEGSPAHIGVDGGVEEPTTASDPQPQEKKRHIREIQELLAMYAAEDWGEEDEESEDEDWEPHSRWYCTNCTMPNSDEVSHCIRCNEHRTSGILNHGYLASSFVPAGEAEYDKVSSQEEGTWSGRCQSPDLMSTGTGGTAVMSSERRTAIGFDDRMLLHEETQKIHPERPNRLRAIIAGLESLGLIPGRCLAIPVREITQAELELVHCTEHINAVEATKEKEDLSYFTPDTYANKHSALAARLAAGICADLATAIMTGAFHNGFAAVRPPGHHAEEETAMGFCLHNNVCVAARSAQSAGANKVLVVDWDVHHGNGTQEIFERDPTILYISLHRHEGGAFYPGTGGAREVGSGPGEGFCVNIPWGCAGIGDADYISAFKHIVLPIARQFDPDITIISAGFDAARGDPLGGCDVTPLGYAHMASLLNSLSGGRMLVVLEGGYNLRSISESAAAVVKVLLGETPKPLPKDILPTPAGATALLEVFSVQKCYWSDLHAPTFLKMSAQLAAMSNGYSRRKRLKQRHRGGPFWWKWGRRRVVYDLWMKRRWKHRQQQAHEHMLLGVRRANNTGP